ncbi:MAG: hypothetical protein ACRDQZ_16890 [Mycobacteriales bacterium]
MIEVLSRRDILTGRAAHHASRTSVDASDWNTYTRPDPPKVSVSFPPSYTLFPRFVTDLTYPYECFSLCNEALTPLPSDDQDGMPNLRDLGAGDAFVTVFADTLTSENANLGAPVPTPLSMSDLAAIPDSGASASGFDRYGAWFHSATWVYTMLIWIGRSSPEGPTISSVVATVNLV